jgi:hypothetical protein
MLKQNRVSKIIKNKDDIIGSNIVDLTCRWTYNICKEYWFDNIFAFKGDITIFKKNWKYWWIKKDWTILAEWFDVCDNFVWWLWRFHKDWNQWWLKEDWSILAEGFFKCYLFKKKFADFEIKDWLFWKLSSNFQSWFSVFKELNSRNWELAWNEWWVWQDAKILSDWYYKCYPFNEECEWFAKFEKKNPLSYMLITWYIDTKWKIYDFSKISPVSKKFKWYAKFERNDWTIWYIDEKHKEWDKIEERGTNIYLQKDWKWFNKILVK